jgi:peptidoglycan/xylan/chitin deacetylase (PgdA/CDA1 family)
VIAIVASVAALLIGEIGLLVGELVEVNSAVGARGRAPDPAEDFSAKMTIQEETWKIEVRGKPHVTVLVLMGERPLGVLTLDENGEAEIEHSVFEGGGGTVGLVPLGTSMIDLQLPPTPTATPTAIVTSTATRTPSATASNTPTSMPTATVTPTPSPQPQPSATKRTGDVIPSTASAPPVLQLVEDAGPRIAITFDGNASSNGTAELLDLLQQHGLRVTLFVTGEFIEREPAIVRRAVLAGHEIGNHTFSHPHLTTWEENRRHDLIPGMTRQRFQEELRKTEQAFVRATGRGLKPLWRAPYGEENRVLRYWALEVGYLHVRWSSLQGASLDSHDWVADEHSSLYKSSARIMERLANFPRLEGGIILMHLASDRAEPPWRELPAFLESLEARGVEPALVTQMLGNSPTWRRWYRRAEVRHREINGN